MSHSPHTPSRKPAPKGKIKGPPHPSATTVLEPDELDGHPMASLHPKTPQGRQWCKAKSKTSGKACGRLAIPGGTVCRWHGGAAPQVRASALERLMALQHPAVDTLQDLMEMRREFPSTGYAAARDVLDRTIGKAAEVVRQEHSGTITIVHELDHGDSVASEPATPRKSLITKGEPG